MRNGKTLKSPLIGRYCGNNTPPLTHSSGQHMLVTFVSDRNNVRSTGFKATFNSNIPGIGATFIYLNIPELYSCSTDLLLLCFAKICRASLQQQVITSLQQQVVTSLQQQVTTHYNNKL